MVTMDKKERNAVIRKRIYLPIVIWLIMASPLLMFKIVNREYIFIGSAELFAIFILVFGFIKGRLLQKTTPGYIIHRIAFGYIILQIVVVVFILAALYISNMQ